MPRISVVIPVFNGERFLGEAIRSALCQTLPPCEVIVVDDGSGDASAQVAASFGSLVQVIQQENRGEAAARNRGIAAAQGDWVAFLDCDDLWKPEKLARQAEYFSGDVDAVHTSFFYFGACEGQVDVSAVPPEVRYSPRYVARRNPFRISSLVVRRDLPLRFPEWTQDGEDLIYFLELSLRQRIALVPEYLTGYRVHAAGQSSRPDMLVRRFCSLERFVENCPAMTPSDKQAVLSDFLALMAEQAVLARYQRRWLEYWTLRRFLAGQQGPLPDEAVKLSREVVLPRFAYRIKDWLDDRLDRHRKKQPTIGREGGQLGQR